MSQVRATRKIEYLRLVEKGTLDVRGYIATPDRWKVVTLEANAVVDETALPAWLLEKCRDSGEVVPVR